ncbi:hypothetical protein [Niallia sp. Krafla_26]|uniref:hypothetical protein n=1 Tax=Niallia sp. Krafla_26 TaxID=3064703 RepID=UPI003D173312
MARFEKQRNFLKSNFTEFKQIRTDIMKGIPKPSIVKSYDFSSTIIALQSPIKNSVKESNFMS